MAEIVNRPKASASRLMDRWRLSSPSLRRVGLGGATYSVVNVAQRSLSFLLLPLYTRFMGPEEYGRLAVVIALSGAVGMILSFSLETHIMRTYFQLADHPAERDRYLSTIGIFLLLAPTVIVSLFLALSAPLLRVIEDVPVSYLALGLFVTSTYVSVTAFPLSVLRAAENLRGYVMLNTTYLLVLLVLIIVFVAGLDAGALGWLVANLGAALLLLPLTFFVLHRYWTQHLSKKYIVAALAFGVPLIPHALCHWGLSLSDRLILGAWTSQADVGIYSAGYQIGAAVGILVTSINQAVMPEYAKRASNQGHQDRLHVLATYQVLAVCSVGLAVALLGPLVIAAILPASFEFAAEVVPLVALGYTLFGLYYIPMNMAVLVGGDSHWIWIATVTATACNVALNLIFVPQFGVMAAAVNTVIGYACLLSTVLLYTIIRRHMLAYEWRRIMTVVGIIAVVYAGAMLTTRSDGMLAGFVRVLWLICMPALLYIVGFWPNVRRFGMLGLGRRRIDTR